MTNLFFGSSCSEEGSVGSRESRDSFISQDVNEVIAQDEPNTHQTDAIIDAEDERDKLRTTFSLMDDDEESDSDNNNDDGEVKTSLPAHNHKEDIFRNPHSGPPTDKSKYISLDSWNTINLLDDAASIQAEQVIQKTQSYSDKFNMVYGEVATAAAANPKPATTSNSNGNKFQNARTSFSTAVKAFADGLSNRRASCDAVGAFPMVASSWDVDDTSLMPGKKRASENRVSIGNHNTKKRRRMPLDIRSELVLMQDQYELTIQSLQRDNSVLLTSKSHLESMLEQSNKALRSAQQESKVSKKHVESLTFQMNEVTNELHQAKQDLLQVRRDNDEARNAEEERMAALKNEYELVLQNERDKHKLEIASLKSHISSVEQTVEECEDVIDRQAAKIVNLEVTLAETTTTATDALEVAKEAEEERDFWRSRAKLSPKANSLAKSFVHTTGYYSCGQQDQETMTPTGPTGKENSNNQASGCCNMCFKERSGIVRWCKCGKVDCHKWVHAQCLAKGKSNNVSTSVSHPGTPPPLLPLILCNGMEQLNRK